MRNRIFAIIACLWIFGAMAHAQSWVTVANFGQWPTIPIGATVRYGSVADNLWTAPKLFTSQQTFIVGSGEFPTSPDPKALATTFVLQVFQLPVAQTIPILGTIAATVPALTSTPPPPAVTPSGSLTGSATPVAEVTYNVTLNADRSFNSGTCTVTAVTK